jgi:diguanylate cyclase (GGDEF)-like protein/PAS domain S-box-containing protein
MIDPELTLSPQQFASAFPFHVAIDLQMRVLQTGAVLRRLCPGLIEGALLDEHFTVQRPALQLLNYNAIHLHEKSLFVLQHRAGPLRLRGQFVVQDRRLIFLGSPWVAEMAEINRLGLSLSDFAVHDPVVDLLFLIQTKNKSLDDGKMLSERLRASQQRLAEAQELAKLGSWLLNLETSQIECSDEACRIYGFTSSTEKITLTHLMALVPAVQRADLQETIQRAALCDVPYELEHRVNALDGVERWVHVTFQGTEKNDVISVRAAVRDETANKRAALRLALAHDIAQLLAADVEPETAIAFILSSIGTRMDWAAAVCWGLDAGSQVRCLKTWTASDDAPLCEFRAGIAADSGQRSDESLEAAWAAGIPLWRTIHLADVSHIRDHVAARCNLNSALLIPVSAGAQRFALEFFGHAQIAIDREFEDFMRSIASQLAQYLRRKQAEVALRHSAQHDNLTGLANRALLQEQLAQALQRAARQKTKVAVLFMDLDRFKSINDSLGHSAGDVLLRSCANRLREAVRLSDTVARFGGDEFVLVIEGLDNADAVITTLEKVVTLFGQPFDVNGRELPTTASIGISVFPDDGQDVETLLMNADAAMYRAKVKGPGNHHFYSSQMSAQDQHQLALESFLPRALEREELFLVYQPKLNLSSGLVTGVEALMRWRHPTLGLVSPLQFIPIAEEIGLIDSLGHWALEVACRDARHWNDQGYPIKVSVNLSARQLNRPMLAEEVARVIARAGLLPAQLELEITESGVMHNPAQAALRLRELCDMGVSLAIDDFGTGYSSLSYLRNFPLSTLKVDRSFIKDLTKDEAAAALATGIFALARSLKMKVVAEGVESLEQLGFLRVNGCDEIQGYCLSKPITANEMRQFFESDLSHFAAPSQTE